ncbi:MAG: OmpA family protein [Cytophagales bacterium]|nr:OmpA family protein [Cytophagales bacterium]
MKKHFFVLLGLFLFAVAAQAQVNNVLNRAKRIGEQRTNQAIDRTINKGYDKVEEGVENAAKKKKKDSGQSNESNGSRNGDNRRNQPDNGDAEGDAGENDEGNAAGGETGKAAVLKSYGKYDFVPGEKVVVAEDFSQDAVGDFPAKWNTNGSGEIVTADGYTGKWLQLSKQTRAIPDFITSLPDNFTLEFDLACNPKFNFYSSSFDISVVALKNRNDNKALFDRNPFDNQPGVRIRIDPTDAGNKDGIVAVECFDGQSRFINNDLTTRQFAAHRDRTKVHVAIWRQKQRLRMYVNEDKVLDLPRAMTAAAYNAVLFDVDNFSKEQDRYLLGNLRLAVGAPDTRNKLITEGKFVTRGILFDVNSDKIKVESYGTLKEIAQVLKENPDVRVKIIGHTDSDGDAAKNMDLSKRRAAAVRGALAAEFGIENARMETDGKGASQPTAPNNSPENKANNRRVEFIKL